jgi:two-component system alkaline phosphatase synthesis response regulator PhoP
MVGAMSQSGASGSGPSTALVLERDPRHRDVLRRTLESVDFRVHVVESPEMLLDRLIGGQPDLVVLDVVDPVEVEIVRIARQRAQVPIVVIGPPSDHTVELVVLALGCDDFLFKPVDPAVFVVRIGHLWTRRPASSDVSSDSSVLGELRIDRSRRIASIRGDVLGLTRIEFEVLALLMTRPGHVFTRTEIVEHVWGGWIGSDHMLDTHVYRLRRKVIGSGAFVRATRGVGYSLDPERDGSSR